MSKNKTQDYNLRDFIWEQEEFKFKPKVNRHKKFLKAKKRQLEKEKMADKKDFSALEEEYLRYNSKIEQSLLSDYYDMEDEDYKGYRVK